ncbi:MAG: DUF2779 domain-containing protein [Candidatus Margulisiibacteriota bacterium]
MAKMPYLSKSKYLAGLQCPKLLWYNYNRKADLPGIGPLTQAVFDEGHRVGVLAQKLFPNGVTIERDRSPEKHSERSLAALKLRQPLFEAGFLFGQAYALADILVPVEDDAWDIVEVKSSTGIKDEHYRDAAFQRYTYAGAGLKIRRSYLMHINKEFVKKGEIDPKRFFTKEDVTDETLELLPGIAGQIATMAATIGAETEPEAKVGPHCTSPRECPLYDLCWDFLPDEGHVFILYRGGKKKFDLMERGILNVTEIPDDFELDEKQLIQVKSHRDKAAHVDKEALKEFLGQLVYPLYFLDFETIGPALPVYDNTGPYKEIPFLFSLFVQDKPGGKPQHFSYLAPGDIDPRPEMLRRLKELLGESGSIVAYNARFEMTCIEKASEVYRDYNDWAVFLKDRFVDLLVPFQQFLFYHPDQAGSASLKKVLPALTHSNYENLEIGEGRTAGVEYYRVTFGENIPPAEKERVHTALEKYCDIDTRGMLEIIEALNEAVAA